MEVETVATWHGLVRSPLRKLWPSLGEPLHVFCKSQHSNGVVAMGSAAAPYQLELVSHIYPAPEATVVFRLNDTASEYPIQVPATTHIVVVQLIHSDTRRIVGHVRRVAAGTLGLLGNDWQQEPDFVCVLPEHRRLVQNVA